MSRNLPLTAALTVVLAAGLTAAGCSSTSDDAPAVADTSTPAPTGVTLTLWHNTADSTALLDLYKAYEKESGNTIELVDIPSDTFPMTVQSKWATGDRPDILEWHGNRMDAQSLDASHTMVDLSNLTFVAKEGQLAKLSGNIDGKTYAATLGPLTVFGLFYNKKVFAAAGLQAPRSYADLAGACKTLKSMQPGVAPIFEAGGSGWPPAVLAGFDYMGEYNVDSAYANDVVAGKAKLDDAGGPLVTGLKAYQTLREEGCFNSDAPTAKWEDSAKALLAGKAAMLAQGTDSINLLNADAGGDTAKVDSTIGFVGLSATKPVANFSPSPLGTYYVPKGKDAKKQRAAVDFVEFVTGTGYQTYVDEAGSVPTISDTTTPKLQGLMQDVQSTIGSAGLTVNSAIPGFGNFGNEVDKLLAGQQTPDKVGSAMQAYYTQAAAALK